MKRNVIVAFVSILVVLAIVSVSTALSFEQSALSEERTRLIVNIRHVDGSVPENDFLARTVAERLDQTNIEGILPDAILAYLTEQEIKELEQHDYVLSVQEIHTYTTKLEDAIGIIEVDKVWDRKFHDVHLDGTGQTICIVDTGVDENHVDLAGKIVNDCNYFCPDDFSPCYLDCSETDTDGHGTHVAGIAAAYPSVDLPGGVAKGANIASMKVFPDGSGTTNDLALRAAVDWCVSNSETYNIGVISMSIGSDTLFTDYCDDAHGFLGVRLQDAIDNNISVVVATSNDASTTGISSPACDSRVIPVSATDKNDNVWVASNYNSLVKLFAPGMLITSTCSSVEGNGNYCVKSGTSMSTPMVAGSFAIAYEVMELDGNPKSMHPKDDLEQLFFEEADLITDLDFENWRRINVNSAINKLIDDLTCVDIGGREICRNYNSPIRI